MTDFAAPGRPGAQMSYLPRYDHWIGGDFVPPVDGRYFENPTPVTGETFTEVARGTAEDVALALDAAHGAAPAWGRTSAGARADVLHRIADRMEANLPALAVAETWESGKPIRESMTADIPLAIDGFRYFAGAIRAQDGSLSEVDGDTVAYHFHEPLGVVGAIVPWNFPILMATWTLAPALAAGNAVVVTPAAHTPASLHFLMSLVADLLPPGVVNIVTGYGAEAGRPLASGARVARTAFTGETTDIFFDDVSADRDDFFESALDGFTAWPSRALLQQGHYEAFLAAAVARAEAMVAGHPLDLATTIGAQTSRDQLAKILADVDAARREGAKILTGGRRREMPGDLAGGYFAEPTILQADHEVRGPGPVVSVAPFTDLDDAVKIADGVPYAGVWTRDGGRAYRAGRALPAGRVLVNGYHAYPAHRVFGGAQRTALLDRYRRAKSLLVSYSPRRLGFL